MHVTTSSVLYCNFEGLCKSYIWAENKLLILTSYKFLPNKALKAQEMDIYSEAFF